MDSNRPLPYREIYFRVGEKLRRGFDWEDWLQIPWRPDFPYSSGNTVRPSQPTGFQLICSTPGQSSDNEPACPTTAGLTVNDGSAVWTAASITTASLVATVSSVVWTPPTGIAVSSPQLSGQIATTIIDASGATAPNDYDVLCAATLSDGQLKIGTLRVKVR